jgi:hypothetical protein
MSKTVRLAKDLSGEIKYVLLNIMRMITGSDKLASRFTQERMLLLPNCSLNRDVSTKHRVGFHEAFSGSRVVTVDGGTYRYGEIIM